MHKFDILKACFWLLAFVVAVALAMMVVVVLGCTYGTLSGRYPLGTCVGLGLPELIHDWWSEILTAILALLVARGSRDKE